RLPFKRLNTEPKENQPPKRPCAHACPQPVDSDGHNENESTPLSERSGPPLVNGRGPIDGFFSRRHPPPSDEKMIIDLTVDKSSSPVKGFPSPASACRPAKSKLCSKDKPAFSGQPPNVEETLKPCSSDSVIISDDEAEELEAEDPPVSTSQLDTTQDSHSEPEEQNESLQEHEEKLRLRQEKERQKEEAKAEKQKKKEEARKLKEEREKEKRERKEKDEREKREKKEKEEKEKAERVKAKEELRKSKIAKLEEKRKREEEKRIKEEEKRLKEEKDRLKAEKAEITRFLQKSKTQQVPKTLAAACGKFAPFEIKENMALAPLTRVQCKDSVLEELDHCLLNPAEKANALKDWIGKKPRQSGATKPRRTDSLDCIVAEGAKPDGVPDRKRYGPMKLLQFHENYRPAYWGTWSKKTSSISPRCPFKQDKDLLDYEVDSDEEWEEEEPGESLSHSEGQEDEEEGGEDDDDDDGFFVPHGYLSEDEGALEEEFQEGGDLEKQKLRQKLKAREWDELMSSKKKMKVLEPVVRGCVWEGDGDGLEIFQCYAVCLFEPLPKTDTSPSPEELSQRVQREDHLGQLLPLLHGNVNSSKVIITEFQEFYRQSSSASSPDSVTPQSQTDNIPTIQLKRLIRSNAVYEKRSNFRRCCWYVHAEVLSRYGQEALPVPCHWTYLTTGAREECREENLPPANPQGNPPTTPSMPSSSSKRKSTGSLSITKFMKRRSEPRQTEATEADGFQADTEDDEDDCII
uniref:Chromatin assembly factor 1, subunit A (p150) n=1 Tax=Oryzias latipes TaxID=8090 RepID=A0A3P9LH16_ORYLA